VSVDSVVQTYWAGATPEEICQDFPTLSLGQVYGVIAYFLARRDDVDAYLKQQQRAAARLRRQLKALHRDFLVDLRRRMLGVSTVRFLFDEDLNGRIVRGVRRRAPHLDTQTVQSAGLSQATDIELLAWAAAECRVVVWHDHRTMRGYAEERLASELPMGGLMLVRQDYPIGQAIDDLVLIAETTSAEDWRGKIAFLPV
jgi:hypothetical protein